MKQLEHEAFSKPLDIIRLSLKEFNIRHTDKETVTRYRYLRYHKRVLGLGDVPWHPIFDVGKVSMAEVDHFVNNLEPQTLASELSDLNVSVKGKVPKKSS